MSVPFFSYFISRVSTSAIVICDVSISKLVFLLSYEVFLQGCRSTYQHDCSCFNFAFKIAFFLDTLVYDTF